MIQGLRGREIKHSWRLTTTNCCSGKKFISSMIKFSMKIQICGCILKFISSHQPLLFNLPKVQTACLWLTIQRHIWIVRSYIMLHIKGGTKTSILINKRFLDIHCWQRWMISVEAQWNSCFVELLLPPIFLHLVYTECKPMAKSRNAQKESRDVESNLKKWNWYEDKTWHVI